MAVAVPMDGSQTFIDENGRGVMAIIAAPAVIALVACVALRDWWLRGRRATGYFAWACVWLLAAFCLVGILSIGLFLAPAFICLTLATSPIRLART